MAPGDLNLKKSWHPALMKNQQKVWELEQEALLERKKIKERQEEIAKERELSELKALQYAKTGKKINDRVEWMYDTSGIHGDGSKLKTGDNEEYLLGKKRVDELIINGTGNRSNDENKKKGFEKLEQEFKNVDHGEELNVKINRDDPMAIIKQHQLKKLQELRKKKQESDERSSSHRRHSSRSRSDSHREDERRSDDKRRSQGHRREHRREDTNGDERGSNRSGRNHTSSKTKDDYGRRDVTDGKERYRSDSHRSERGYRDRESDRYDGQRRF